MRQSRISFALLDGSGSHRTFSRGQGCLLRFVKRQTPEWWKSSLLENDVLFILCPHSSKAHEISSDLWDHHQEHLPSKGSEKFCNKAVSHGRSGECLICQAPLPYVYTQKAELRSYDSHWVVYKVYNVYYLALARIISPPRLHQHKIRFHLEELWLAGGRKEAFCLWPALMISLSN